MILLEDCPKASIIESRYMANYIDLASNFGGCVEFTSVLHIVSIPSWLTHYIKPV